MEGLYRQCALRPALYHQICMTGIVSAAARSCRYRKARLGTVATSYELRHACCFAARQDGTNGRVVADDTAAVVVCTENIGVTARVTTLLLDGRRSRLAGF